MSVEPRKFYLCILGGIKGSSSVQYLFCMQKVHADSKAPPSDISKKLEKYIGKLEPTILDSKIKFSVNVVFRKNKKIREDKMQPGETPTLT